MSEAAPNEADQTQARRCHQSQPGSATTRLGAPQPKRHRPAIAGPMEDGHAQDRLQPATDSIRRSSSPSGPPLATRPDRRRRAPTACRRWHPAADFPRRSCACRATKSAAHSVRQPDHYSRLPRVVAPTEASTDLPGRCSHPARPAPPSAMHSARRAASPIQETRPPPAYRTWSTNGSAIAEVVPSCSGVSRASSTRDREKWLDRKSKLGPDAMTTG